MSVSIYQLLGSWLFAGPVLSPTMFGSFFKKTKNKNQIELFLLYLQMSDEGGPNTGKSDALYHGPLKRLSYLLQMT